MEPSPVKKGAWGKSSVVVIRRISSPEHPASGQLGLFAAKKIPPKTHIVDYIGEYTVKIGGTRTTTCVFIDLKMEAVLGWTRAEWATRRDLSMTSGE